MKGNKYRLFDSYRPKIRKFDIENRLLLGTSRVLDIDQVLEGKEFTKDELLIAKLVIAEQAYLSGLDKIGDRLIEGVLQTEGKSKDVMFYVYNLQANKKLLLQKAKIQNKYTYIKTKKVNY